MQQRHPGDPKWKHLLRCRLRDMRRRRLRRPSRRSGQLVSVVDVCYCMDTVQSILASLIKIGMDLSPNEASNKQCCMQSPKINILRCSRYVPVTNTVVVHRKMNISLPVCSLSSRNMELNVAHPTGTTGSSRKSAAPLNLRVRMHGMQSCVVQPPISVRLTKPCFAPFLC